MITIPTQAAKEGPAAFNAAGYSGPLSLLLELIEQRKVDICEVSLADITDDYLRRISALEWPDLEESSRFLVIAATLIFIKARVLMPRRKDLEAAQEEEEGPDPAELLVDRLRAYKLFRDAARKFKVLEAEASRMYGRGRYEQLGVRWQGNPLEGVLADDFWEIIQRLEDRNKEAAIAAPYEETPLADFMNSLLGALKNKKSEDFIKALGVVKDMGAVIGSLLALLELAKMGIITISQASTGGPIWMAWREEAQDGPVADESSD